MGLVIPIWRRFRFRQLFLAVLLVSIGGLYALYLFEGHHLRAAGVTRELLKLPNISDKCAAIFASDVSPTNFDDNNRQRIIDRVQLMRLYGHCFLRNDHHFSFTKEKLDDIEASLFPAINFSPRATIKAASGRGIVMSLSAHGRDDLQRLLKVLDLLENQLPIEIFYRQDVDEFTLREINTGSQQVRWVNVDTLVNSLHAERFQRFGNKWLAVLLTSFEEILCIDIDVVPFVVPVSFFRSVQYKRTGSYFFRDREQNDRISNRDVRLYRHLLPSPTECNAFNMPFIDSYQAISGIKHIMESGLVALNRTKFFSGLLIASSLQLWGPTSRPVWGDKELFWLGQLASGEPDFEFNRIPAGAIGEIEYDDLNERSRHICSIQPAHIDSERNLLWINSGLRNCKLSTAHREFREIPSLGRKFASSDSLLAYFGSGLRATGVIIPPFVPPERYIFNFFPWIKRKQMSGFQQDHELGCNGYFWCAYDTPSHPGITITFSSKVQQQYDRIFSTWIL